jgi:serine/threonine protein phosphatase PrpC
MKFIWENIGSRPYMEDTYSFDVNMPYGFSYYGLFDGHGGKEVSLYLKENMKHVIVKHIKDAMKINESFIDVQKVLYESFKTIINDIPYKTSMTTGSTALVILKHSGKVWVANAGDTRAIMNDGLGVIQLSHDHKPNETKEHKRITSLGGKVIKAFQGDVYRVNGVLAVSRAVGDFSLSPHVTWKPEITTFNINKNNHYIFMATDGVWDVLSNQSVVNIINEMIINEQWKHIGDVIISVARNNGSGDNIACILVVL